MQSLCVFRRLVFVLLMKPNNVKNTFIAVFAAADAACATQQRCVLI